jgi:hypothetical protein
MAAVRPATWTPVMLAPPWPRAVTVMVKGGLSGNEVALVAVNEVTVPVTKT